MVQVVQHTDNAVKGDVGHETRKYLSFVMHGDHYAIEILKIKEIIEFGEITAVPMMPNFVCGAINLRGQAIPVMDLGRRLGKPSFDASRRTCVLVVEMMAGDLCMDVGVVVDSVSRVMDISSATMDPPPTFGGQLRADFMLGMGKVEGQFVIVLNIDRVLSFDDLDTLAYIQGDVDVTTLVADNEEEKDHDKRDDRTN